jgi:iron(III) transport system substrate-binding protein
MKKILSIILVLVMMLSMVACNTTSEEPQEAPEANEPANEEANQEEETPELEDKVVIYSTHGEDMIEIVADAFEEETGIKVEFINLKGELSDRVRAEKENPQSDVMYGGSSAVFMELQSEDLFEAYAPSWADQVDPLFKDSENFWFGTIQTPVMMAYNSDMLTVEEAPTDWADLTDEKYNEQIVVRNALSSSARATMSCLIQQYEVAGDIDGAWDYLKAVDVNTKQYFGSGSLMMQAVGRQEAAITYAPLNSIIDNKMNNNIPLEVVNATSGSPIITDGIALINNAPHTNAAKAFIDFAGSADIQALLAVEFNRMPTNEEAFASSPEWMSEIEITAMDVDWADLALKQSQWMQTWDTEIKDSSKDAE